MAKTFDELAGRTTDALTRGRAARRTRELLRGVPAEHREALLRVAVTAPEAMGAAFVGACTRCGAGYAAADPLGARQTACPGCRTGELVWAENAFADAALDEVYDIVDALLRAGEWPAADAILRSQAPVSLVPTDKLLALLVATAPAKSRLPGRAAFLAEVRSAMAARGEDEARLLEGLE
jgi:hypothetical protein